MQKYEVHGNDLFLWEMSEYVLVATTGIKRSQCCGDISCTEKTSYTESLNNDCKLAIKIGVK